MLNMLKDPRDSRRHFSCLRLPVVAALVLIVVLQSACFFSKKTGTEAAVTSPIRLVLLPFNVGGHKDLQWASLAAPVLMTKAGEKATGLDIVPFWQTMPVALTGGGASRMFTEESAANVAGWLSAKWCVIGELSPTKNGVSMTIDFIPARSTLIPFRYIKNGKLDSIGAGFYEAYSQFLRYLVASPLEPVRNPDTMNSVKNIAEAVNREYGWFVEAEPGKAQEIVTGLAASDVGLARSLFNPGLYPLLAPKK